MKYSYLVILFLIWIPAQSQDLGQVYFNIQNRFDAVLATYNCDSDKGPVKVTRDSIFRAQYRKIFSTVILNSEDIVNNGSAISFTEDKDKNTLSFNISFFGQKKHNWMVNLGANIKNKDSNYSFYSDGKWGNEIGGKVGVVIPIFGSSQYFNNDKKCEEVIENRKLAMEKKILEYNKLLSSNLPNLRDELRAYQHKIDLQRFYPLKDTIDYSKKVKSLEDKIQKLEEMRFYTLEDVAERVDNDITQFDVKNNIFTGYRTHWININASFKNDKLTIKNDSIINAAIGRSYPSVYKFTADVSYNFARNTSGSVIFFQCMPLRIKRGSLLDNVSLVGQDVLLQPYVNPANPDDTYYNLIGSDTPLVGRYDNVRDALWNMDTGLYAAIFCAMEKTLGFSSRLNFNFPTFNNLPGDYKQNFTFLVGALLRIGTEKSWSTATLSLNAGFENIPYNVNVWDRFLLKASVGIPFNISSKSKE